MANQLAALPWIVDTPSDVALASFSMKINHITYVGYADASSSVEVQDKNGHMVALLQGNAEHSPVNAEHEIGWINGLKVPTSKTDLNPNLQSGKLIIYVE